MPDANKVKPPLKCGPQRHMTDSEWKTYDGMMAASYRKSKADHDVPVFYGKLIWLANRNNSSRQIEGRNARNLERKGWLISTGRQQRWHGRMSTVRYELVSHDDYASMVGYLRAARKTDTDLDGMSICPPWKYDPETGDEVIKGNRRLGQGLARRNMRRKIEPLTGVPDSFLDHLVEIDARRKKRP